MKRALVLTLALLFAPAAYVGASHDHGPHDGQCPPHIAGAGTIIPSGRDHDVLPLFQEAVDVLYGPTGVLTRLGYSHPEHVLHFLPGNQINCLVANNRHALPHPFDGANVIHGLSKGSGVLEFVCPSGCPMRSFYKDTLPFEQQISILLHVAGHYHFIHHSRFYQKREIDIFAESYRMAFYMEELYRRLPQHEVWEWYQFLMSLEMAQDLSRGIRNAPEDFDPARIARINDGRDWRTTARLQHPASPTANILQAYVANLPSTLPDWKREMAIRFERLHRYISGAALTKIINEGFATISQEIAVEHLEKYNSLRFGIEYGHLHQGVTTPSLQNPYWFGRELFRSLRRRFNERPEVKNLEPLERDRQFILWVTKEVIEKRDSYETILFALDAAWIHKYKLTLKRPLEDWSEWDHSLPPPRNPEHTTQWMLLSREPERIIRKIAREVADFDSSFPRALVIDLQEPTVGGVQLGFRDEYGSKIPLQRTSLVTTLYVHAKLMGRPIVLDTVKASTWDEKPRDPWNPWQRGPFRIMPPWIDPWGWGWPRPEPLTMTPLRVVVTPEGKVTVYDVKDKPATTGDEPTPAGKVYEPNATLEKDFTRRLKKYLADSNIGRLTSDVPTLRTEVAGRIADSVANNHPSGLLFHAPTTAGALHQYHSFLQLRLAEVLAQAIRGERTLVRGPNGVAVRALPRIPSFRFDSTVRRRMLKETPAPRVDRLSRMQIAPFEPDDVSDIGSEDGPPGTHIWGPHPRDDDDGDGDGDDDDGDGRPRPGKPPGDGQGYDPSDPSWVVIPPDLYADVLNEAVELPRLRPKSGISPLKDQIPEGATPRREGEPVHPRIVQRAIQRGLASQGPDEQLSRGELLRRGYRLLRPEDWRVRGTETEPNPDINAVVFFLMDGSGSMGGARLAAAKKLLYDLKVILKRKYPKVEFRFITFDTRALVHEKEEDFFALELLGGTDYVKGIEKTIEVQEKFPRSKYDRYVVAVGDMEDGGDTIINLFKTLAQQSEYCAVVRTAEYLTGAGTLAGDFENLAAEDPYVGYLDLAPTLTYVPGDFRKLFKNGEKK